MRTENITPALGLACAAWLIAADPLGAQPLPFQPGTDVAFDQKLGEAIPRNVQFRDAAGRPVVLGDCLRDRPVLLMLIQYRCPMLCDLTLEGTVRSLKAVTLDPGRDFHVLIVSFDPREAPELARRKRETTLERYDRPGTEHGWHFLTGSREAIEQLTRSAGFRYFYDQRKDQYAHPAGLIVLTPKGRISRYLPGVNPPARDLKLGLIEASRGRIGTLADRMLLLCYAYDPATGRYGFAILTAVRIAGGLTVLGLAAGIVVLLRRERRRPDSRCLSSLTIEDLAVVLASRRGRCGAHGEDDWHRTTDHGPRTSDDAP